MAEKKKLRKVPKFVQISRGQEDILALDEGGCVWFLSSVTKAIGGMTVMNWDPTWHKLTDQTTEPDEV